MNGTENAAMAENSEAFTGCPSDDPFDSESIFYGNMRKVELRDEQNAATTDRCLPLMREAIRRRQFVMSHPATDEDVLRGYAPILLVCADPYDHRIYYSPAAIDADRNGQYFLVRVENAYEESDRVFFPDEELPTDPFAQNLHVKVANIGAPPVAIVPDPSSAVWEARDAVDAAMQSRYPSLIVSGGVIAPESAWSTTDWKQDGLPRMRVVYEFGSRRAAKATELTLTTALDHQPGTVLVKWSDKPPILKLDP